jgi:hypothetical protein
MSKLTHEQLFRDGETTFLLSSSESDQFKGPLSCKLVKTVKNRRTCAYLISVDFRPVFGIEYYIIAPKHIGSFGNKIENDVYILAVDDVESVMRSNVFADDVRVLAWGHIHDLQN